MFEFGSWQGTAGSQRLELTVANVGTTGYPCKELRVPKAWNSRLPTWGTTGGHCKELPVPKGWNSRLKKTRELWFTIASNCRFPGVENSFSQPGNQRLPLQRTSGTQRLELTVANVKTTGYHCKALPVPRGWNWFPTFGYHCKQLPVPRR